MKKYCKTNDPAVREEIDQLMAIHKDQKYWERECMVLQGEKMVRECIIKAATDCFTYMRSRGLSRDEADDIIRKVIHELSEELE